MWAGQGVTSPDGKRAAPSADALYPLELYVVTASQVLRYLPDGQRTETRAVPDLRPGLTAAASGQPHVGAAPAIIIVAAVPGRTRRKYGARAEAFAQLQAGHAAQNLLLQSAARGLAAVPVGSLDPVRAAVTLALPPGQTVLYLIQPAFPRDRTGRTRQSARWSYARLPRCDDQRAECVSGWQALGTTGADSIPVDPAQVPRPGGRGQSGYLEPRRVFWPSARLWRADEVKSGASRPWRACVRLFEEVTTCNRIS